MRFCTNYNITHPRFIHLWEEEVRSAALVPEKNILGKPLAKSSPLDPLETVDRGVVKITFLIRDSFWLSELLLYESVYYLEIWTGLERKSHWPLGSIF